MNICMYVSLPVCELKSPITQNADFDSVAKFRSTVNLISSNDSCKNWINFLHNIFTHY